MKTFILITIIIGLNSKAFSDELSSSVPTNEIASVKNLFSMYEINNSKILNKYGYASTDDMGLPSINDNNVVQKSEEIISYYLSHTNEVSAKFKFLIGWCYGNIGKFTNAIALTKEYSNVYSNDFRAWTVLGTSYIYLKSPDKAINAFTNAVRLGDKKGYIALAGAAIMNNSWDIVQSILPQLLDLKKNGKLSEDNQLDLAVILASYSIKMQDKEIFIKALNDITARQISSRNDLQQLVTLGCELFKGPEIDKIRKELKSSGEKPSPQSTNAPPAEK